MTSSLRFDGGSDQAADGPGQLVAPQALEAPLARVEMEEALDGGVKR